MKMNDCHQERYSLSGVRNFFLRPNGTNSNEQRKLHRDRDAAGLVHNIYTVRNLQTVGRTSNSCHIG